MIKVGIILVLAGLVMIYAFYNMVDLGLVAVVIGIFFILVGVFTPRVEAKGGYPMAGITEVMVRASVEPKEVEVEEAPVEEVGADEDEIDLLARLITAEIGYSNAYDPVDYEDACYLTGSVVLNRMKNPKWPDTIEGVIYQPGQYAVVDNGMINRPYDEVAFEIAEELLTYGTIEDPGIVYQATFRQGSGVYRQIGATYFCFE